jgi:hypothetical protein
MAPPGRVIPAAVEGFQAIRVKVLVEGDAPREELDDIVRHANMFSPVANTMRNPIPFDIKLA